jgi:secreted trypsin-like serine protease
LPGSTNLPATTNLRNDIAGGAVGSVPGVAAIDTFSQDCTGSVIAPRIVLTAAHCLDGVATPSSIAIRLADTNQNLAISHYYRAPGFNDQSHQNDAAVLILKSPSRTPALGVVSTEPAAGTAATITGYGQHTYTSAISQVAYSASTTVQSFAACQAAWAEFGSAFPSSDICADNSPYDNATLTRGDSGGPLLVNSLDGHWRIAGINDLVMIPNDVYDGAIPQAFVAVDAIRPWIEDEIARFGKAAPNHRRSAARSVSTAPSAGSSMVAAQAMWASGRISRASAGR